MYGVYIVSTLTGKSTSADFVLLTYSVPLIHFYDSATAAKGSDEKEM